MLRFKGSNRFIALALVIFSLTAFASALVVYAIDTDQALAFATFLAAVFAGGSALGAVLVVLEMRRDRIERIQPFLIVDFEADEKGGVWCTLKNLGAGVARHVVLTFDPVPLDHRSQPLSEWSWIQSPISVMAPGTSYRQFFHVSHELFDEERDGKNFVAFRAAVEYWGDYSQHHRNEYRFDLASWKSMTLPPKTVEYHLEKLVRAVQKLS